MDRTEILERMGYHPATPTTAPHYDEVRQLFIELAFDINDATPDGREQSLAITHLEEALMWTSKAIARTTPLDTTNAHVARVLPPGDVAPADTAAPPGWTCHRCQRNYDAGISKVMCCPTDCPPGRPVCEQCANDLHPPDKPGGLVTSPVQ